jgi:hypothetical protein
MGCFFFGGGNKLDQINHTIIGFPHIENSSMGSDGGRVDNKHDVNVFTEPLRKFYLCNRRDADGEADGLP